MIALVFAEAAVPCLLGAAMGVGLAFLLTKLLPSLIPPGDGADPTLTPMVLGVATLCAAIVAFASSAIPALRLKRMDIATALSGRA
ncbi:MAG: FtsX-like permease family protein [Alphaproteobacteria bacterium]